MTGCHGVVAGQALAWLRACALAGSLLSWTSPVRLGPQPGTPIVCTAFASLQKSKFTPRLWFLFGLLIALCPWNLHSPLEAADSMTGGGAEASPKTRVWLR